MAFLGKYKKLSPTEQKVRLDLLQYGIAEGGTIPWKEAQRIARESLGESQGEDAPEVDSVLKGLEERHYFKRDEEGEICYLYPFSAYPTDYHVFLEDGRDFYAMCAIDAMGSAVTFDMPITVKSCCRDTKEEVLLRLSPEKGLFEAKVNGKTDHAIYATYFDVNARYIDFNC